MKLFKNLRSRIEERVDNAFPVDSDTPVSTSTKDTVRWGYYALWIGVAVFLLWAAFAPLGQGVPAQGSVKIEGNRKTIQHPKGGIVEEILVREGDFVKANQPLIRLNPTQALAQSGIVQTQLVTLLAVEARLLAERNNDRKITFPKDLLLRKDQPLEKEAMSVQSKLFMARRNALSGEIDITNETIAGLQQQIKGLEAQEQAKATQLELYQEELKTLKPLYDEGFIPRNRMFELQRGIAYLSGQRSEDIANIGRVRNQIGELKLKKLQAKNLFRKDVETQLTDVQRQVGDFKERNVATMDELDRIELRAPVAGTVVDLAVHTVGGVISAGQKLMDVVPSEQNLIIEVNIPPHLVDNLYTGLEADVHLSALDQTIVPSVKGRLVYLSADSITDPRSQLSYFVGRVALTKEGQRQLGAQTIQPGMPADVVLLTSERTLLSYLFQPLFRRLQFSFRER